MNPESGEHYQPTKALKVSIQLLENNLDDGKSVNVVHFGKKTEVMESSVKGKTVEFETDGFSVYVLAGIKTYTITFKAEDPDMGTYTTYNEQIVKDGEKPFIPQLPSTDTEEFCGWYEGDETQQTSTVTLNPEPYNFSKEIDDDLVLYAKFTRYAYVIFHDQYDSESNTWPVAHTRRAELTGDAGSQSALVQINDLSAPYTGSAKVAFCGWSYSKVTTPGVS